jgi:ABC-2 type transport system permease protein
MLLLLLKPKFLTLRNSLDVATVSKRLPLAAMGAFFWGLLYIGTYRVLAIIRGIDFFGEALAEKLFSMTFFSLAGFLVLSNIIASISSFYLSKDMPFLLARPLGVPDILRFKTFMTLANSSWMVAVFLTPVLIAYGTCYRAPAMYYLFMPLAFSMYLLMAAGLGISIAHLLTRVFPARRSRDIFVGAIIVLFLVFYFVIRSALPHDLSAPEAVIGPFIKFAPDSPLFPDYWITRGVFPLLLGKKPDVFYVFVLFINAVFFLLLSSVAGRVFFLSNIERLLPSEKKSGVGLLRRFYPRRSLAPFYKDTISFFRDKGQWSQIFVILALIAVYIYNFRSLPLEMIAGATSFGKEIMAVINMVMAGLVLSAVAARFLYTSVSLEGMAFWVVRTSPVGLRRFVCLKLLYGCIPLAFLMVALVTLTNSALAVKGPLMLASVGTILILSISISGLATGLGAVYPNFRYENIASVSVSAGAMVFMLLAFGLVIITVSLESWIYYLLAVRQSMPHRFPIFLHIVVCVICIFLLNGAAFYLPIKAGAGRLLKDPSQR